MKKYYIFLYLCMLSLSIPAWGTAQVAQTEKLGRGVVAVNMSTSEGQKKAGIFLSWRFLDTDDKTTAFNVYRDGVLLEGSPVRDACWLVDRNASGEAAIRLSGSRM